MAYRPKAADADARLKEPQSLEAEQAVLGSVLRSQEALNRVLEVIDNERHFHSPKHRTIFRAVLDLYDRNEPCDITTVADWLNRNNELQKAGGRVYLADLIESVASTANVEAHARIVLDKAILRNLISSSESIIESAYNMQDDVSELLDKAESTIFDIAQTRMRQGFVTLGDLMPSTFEHIEKLRSGGGAEDGVSSGFDQLDVMTNGLHKGELVIVAGRPSMGKSAIVMNIAEHVAMEEKKKVCVFSVEMSAASLAMRMLCGRAKVSQQRLRSGRVSDEEMLKLTRAGVLSEAQIFIDDTPGLTPLAMKAKARRLKGQQGVDLIVVDYIQMMSGSGRFENRQQEIASLSRNLKQLAMELEVPVVACSQLSRQVEQREGKKPQLSDLRESGAIEQDADVVMFVYRPEYYFSHLEKTDPKFLEVEGKAEIIVAKQRNGPTGTVHLAFLKEFARFENMAYRSPELPPDAEPVEPSDMPF